MYKKSYGPFTKHGQFVVGVFNQQLCPIYFMYLGKLFPKVMLTAVYLVCAVMRYTF